MKRKMWIAVIGFVALVAMAMLFRGPEKVEVAGKSVGFWLDEMAEGGTRSNAAVAVFLKEGSRVVPALTNELRFVPPMRTNFIHLKARLPWAVASLLPRAPQINWIRRYAAAHALQRLGPEAKAAVPALLAVLTSSEIEEMMMKGQNGGMLVGQSVHYGMIAAAMDALAKIDGQSPQVLAAAARLASETGLQRGVIPGAMPYESAMRALEAGQNINVAPVEKLLEMSRLQEREFYFRELSAFASGTAPNRGIGMSLNELHGETNTLLALKSRMPRFREAAAFELGDPEREGWNRFQEPGLKITERGIAALVEALNDAEEKVRLNAAETLVKIGLRENDAEVMAALVGLLEATNSLVRLRAVDNLGRMGPRAKDALPKLEAVGKNDVGLVRVWARKAAVEIGRPASAEPAKAGTTYEK